MFKDNNKDTKMMSMTSSLYSENMFILYLVKIYFQK